MKLHLKKWGVYLQPDDDESAAWLAKKAQGAVIEAECKEPRNYRFHKKYFALLNHAFDCWEPMQEYKGRPIEKNFDRFRKDVQIMAGYYDIVANLKNEPRYESKSISFGSMSEDEFEKLYSAVIDVVLKYILKNYTKDDLENVVMQTISFI